MTEKEIEQKLYECFKELLILYNIKEFEISDFYNYDIKKDFDLMTLYDYEILVEEKFFNSEDIIPDNSISKIKDFIKFIKENTK